MKKWLRAQPAQPATIVDLQTLLDTFAEEYNQRRPHRSLQHRATPATIYTSRPKATPVDRTDDTHDRIRHTSTSATVCRFRVRPQRLPGESAGTEDASAGAAASSTSDIPGLSR